MSELGDALARLEEALRAIDHPLADPAVRPAGRPADESRQAARTLLDVELPDELVELWSWWGGGKPHGLLPFADQLPGWVGILSLEEAVALVTRRRDAGITTPESDQWLPVLYEGDMVTLYWCELPNSTNGQVPVTAADYIDIPDLDSMCRLRSLAEFINSISDLAESGQWVDDERLGWHYTGPPDQFPWLA